MILFSKACEYSLQSVIFLAAQTPNRPVLQRDISKALNIPPHFLGKILQLLTRHGIVSSQKGKSGGFLLNRSPKDISLFDVVQIIDGITFLNNCVLGFPGCGDEIKCPVHDEWNSTKDKILQMLKNKHISELSQDINTKLDYIKLLNNNFSLNKETSD